MGMEPVAVTPAQAFKALGIGTTKGYELINEGKLKSFTIGRARRVTVASIRELVDQAA